MIKKNNRPLVCTTKQISKNICPSRMAKYSLFPALGEERRTPSATSRPLDHGSTGKLQGRHLHRLALPNTKRVGRGLSLCRDLGFIVARAVFDQHADNLQREKANRAAGSPLKKIRKNRACFSPFPHSGGTRISSAVQKKKQYF